MKRSQYVLFLAGVALASNSVASTGKDARNVATPQALAMAATQTKAVPVAPIQQQIQMPAPEAMIIMIRASLVALSQANVTNNYSVLNALGSDNFRQANSPARLAALFAPFRTNNIDLAPVVFVTPQLSQQPKIVDGRLRLIGFFPTQPMQVNYDIQYEPSGGTWRLFGLSVNLNPAQQQPAQLTPGQGGQAPSR
jgi:hypothetical protein